MSKFEERLSRQAIRREYIQSELYERHISVIGQLVDSVLGTLFVLFVIGLAIAGLNWLAIISDEYLPDSIKYSNPESGLGMYFGILYLVGPIAGLLSIWIYHRVNQLERAIRHRMLVNANFVGWEKDHEVDELIRLQNEERDLREKVVHKDYDENDPDRNRYSEVIGEIYRRKEKLLGFNWFSLITLVALLIVNWSAIGSQFYYGVRWALISKWLSMPILIIWILVTLWFTVIPALERRLPKPNKMGGIGESLMVGCVGVIGSAVVLTLICSFLPILGGSADHDTAQWVLDKGGSVDVFFYDSEVEFGTRNIHERGVWNIDADDHKVIPDDLPAFQIRGIWLHRAEKINDDDLAHINGLSNLRFLHLGGQPITDAGIEKLNDLPELDHIVLDGTDISDRGLRHLVTFTKLERVSIGGKSSISDEAKQDLKDRLPNCKIVD